MLRVLPSDLNAKKFAAVIQLDYSARSSQDPSYSMRKYARDLGISDSSLLQYLKGRRRLSPRVLSALGSTVGLSDIELANLINAEEPDENDRYKIRNEDHFLDISDWRLDALRELLDGQPIDLDIEALARRLSIDGPSIRLMIESLISQSLLVQVDGVFKNLLDHPSSILNPGQTSKAAREYQKSLLDSSIEKIDSVDAHKRNHTSLIIKMKPADLPAAIGVIRQFRRKFAEEFEVQSADDLDLYAVHVGLFPLLTEEHPS